MRSVPMTGPGRSASWSASPPVWSRSWRAVPPGEPASRCGRNWRRASPVAPALPAPAEQPTQSNSNRGSARHEAEAGEAVAGYLGGQLGLPAQIGAHRRLVAGMPVVVPEYVVDALGIGRLVGRGG